MRWAKLCLAASLFLLVGLGVRGAAQTAAPPESTLGGVYTADQAKRGEESYMNICVGCHSAGTYVGPQFMSKWEGKPLSDLFELMSEKMPKDDPGSLELKEYAQIIAFILRQNKMPDGKSRAGVGRRSLEEDQVCGTEDTRGIPRGGDETMAVTGKRTGRGGAGRRLRADRGNLRLELAAGRAGRGRARQRARRMALLGRRRVEHALLAARSDQRHQLQPAPGRVAVERRRRSAPTSTTGRRRSTRTAGSSPSRRRAASPSRSIRRPGKEALDLEARRGHPLAEGAATVRRPRSRLLDRRHATSASSS